MTVSRDVGIFINFPHWTEDATVSVEEVKPDGTITPFPNARWNA